MLGSLVQQERNPMYSESDLEGAVAGGVLTPAQAAAFRNVVAASAAIAGIGAWLHWRRFKVPITIAVGVAAGVALVLGLIASAFVTPNMSEAQGHMLKTVLLGASLVLGIGTFLFAMRWDASDPTRETRRSDVAFWLHLLAAPLIVHPVFELLGLTHGAATTLDAVVVLALYV